MHAFCWLVLAKSNIPKFLTMHTFRGNCMHAGNGIELQRSDWDEDCADGLVCWYDDDETGNIPGCTGTPRDGWEYCIDPDMIFTNATHVEWLDDFADDLGPGEYGRCQGDCGKSVGARVFSCRLIY